MHIFIDWGSTNFRAFLRENGRTADRREARDAGTLKKFCMTDAASRIEAYSAFLIEQVKGWPKAPVYICGAAGSREGWIETVYTEAPAGFSDVAQKLHKLTADQLGHAAGYDISIVTGCAVAYSGGRHDTMRSEEVKSLGAAAHLGLKDALLCIPGTHCKWVRIANEKIVDFQTAMTGEMYNLMSEAGSIGAVLRGSEAKVDMGAFDQGLKIAAEGCDLLTDLWQVRAQKLRSKKTPELSSYFSGILIGHELRQMAQFYSDRNVVLLADAGDKKNFYRQALNASGWRIRAEIDSEAAVCAGLERLASGG